MFSAPLACVCVGGGGTTGNGPSDSVAITEVPFTVSQQETVPAERQQSFIGARLKKFSLFERFGK